MEIERLEADIRLQAEREAAYRAEVARCTKILKVLQQCQKDRDWLAMRCSQLEALVGAISMLLMKDATRCVDEREINGPQ